MDFSWPGRANENAVHFRPPLGITGNGIRYEFHLQDGAVQCTTSCWAVWPSQAQGLHSLQARGVQIVLCSAVSHGTASIAYGCALVFFKSHSLNHYLRHLYKNYFLYLLLSNRFHIFCVHSRESFSLYIFGYQEIRNRRWLYLDNQIKKVVHSLYVQKKYNSYFWRVKCV